MKDRVYTFKVPMYDSTIKLVVCDDIRAGAKRYFGHEFSETYEALSVYRGNEFGLIFGHDRIALDNICHELYHVTCRVMECMNTKAGPENHEPYAYVQGYIGGKVFKKLRQWRIPLK